MLKVSLTPGRKKAEVFGYFGYRPMPHSVVVRSTSYIASLSIRGRLQNLNFKLTNLNVVFDDKMISNEKVINYKVLYFLEIYNFHFSDFFI